ncbi:protocatechuate 3,4-dioxygenase subunit alpha [Streptomyces armeniacus]|uniref:Protocatechuate 3,4-dioxygenase subunit alpha n=1 Tax=Streptomyces armeniacus TaxID=83291 RepID=A0A345XI97_9ACTN|nr:protocatechuate 3,4-dioxygenase subunit alpha [Streptomyces armeniacus]AXK31363.1 protocatechuate 3,4-dioxygenase subunit alpha [Streptomyces armeniacus]
MRTEPGGTLPPTPSHTVGPFYGHALPFDGGGDIAPASRTDAVTVHGHVLDGNGDPVPDALLETWQADPVGNLAGRAGSLRRDPATGRHLGRNGADFTGFGRTATDADGHWAVRTLRPGRTGGPDAPYLSVCVFARGLLHHLFTRVYLPDPPDGAEALARDPLLASLPAARRRTLVAEAEPYGVYRFDIRLQGAEETVFLDFR